MTDYDELPLVYSCSGCSSAAQMANDLAVSLDRNEVAEMSCIAGVGGDVGPLVEAATDDRPIVAIDGCPLECTKACLDNHDVSPDRHYNLATMGVPKEYHTDYDQEQADELLAELTADIEELAEAGAEV
ncbi:putative zinc-binding protein [Halobiforma nitratireducens]|uniref:DGC domain-containing protein n=1 Tax=Halobiforma nitratireducens JCM 10879 TaxID=1227454 RepID=M0LIL3_9EURY|nr:putative zinc-binding protein [Halobiforma nitratireducens]EMA33366.1 DGC domain-containing protein [Halobiforma nitratireducens JCM 10879]